jgi:hypothetical protein
MNIARNYMKNFLEIPQIYLNPFYHSNNFLQEKISYANYGLYSFDLATKARGFQNPTLKTIAEFSTLIFDFIGKIFCAPFYNLGVFLYNNAYVKLKNRSIEKHNQILQAKEAKKWNKTAFCTWAKIGFVFFSSLFVAVYFSKKFFPFRIIYVTDNDTKNPFLWGYLISTAIIGITGVTCFGLHAMHDAESSRDIQDSISDANLRTEMKFKHLFQGAKTMEIPAQMKIPSLADTKDIELLVKKIKKKHLSLIEIRSKKNDLERLMNIDVLQSAFLREGIECRREEKIQGEEIVFKFYIDKIDTMEMDLSKKSMFVDLGFERDKKSVPLLISNG